MTFDLDELNCQNKDLDVGLDALGRNWNLFLHKTYLLAEFTCHLSKILSLIWALFLLQFGRLIGLRVRNPKQLSLHQMDFCSSRYSSRNGQRSILAECEIGLWMLWFPCSLFFLFFLPYMYKKVWILAF